MLPSFSGGAKRRPENLWPARHESLNVWPAPHGCLSHEMLGSAPEHDASRPQTRAKVSSKA